MELPRTSPSQGCPVSIRVDDTQLRQHVLDALDFEPSIDSTDIGVAAENGVVTLSGNVTSFAQKVSSEHAALRVMGVKAIIQDIQVRVPGDKQHNDDELALRAVSVVAWNSSVPRGAVKLRVRNGLVTLIGQVAWNYQREAAEAAVRTLSAVVDVVNDIRIGPMTVPTKVTFDGVDPSPALSADIERHASKLIRFAPDLLGCEVTVSRAESSHRQGNRYLVRVRAKLRDGSIEAGRTPEPDRSHVDPHIAVRDSFDAVLRQLEHREGIQHDRMKARPANSRPE